MSNEKLYGIGDPSDDADAPTGLPLKDLALDEWEGDGRSYYPTVAVHELARDLIAAQARIAELEQQARDSVGLYERSLELGIVEHDQLRAQLAAAEATIERVRDLEDRILGLRFAPSTTWVIDHLRAALTPDFTQRLYNMPRGGACVLAELTGAFQCLECMELRRIETDVARHPYGPPICTTCAVEMGMTKQVDGSYE